MLSTRMVATWAVAVFLPMQQVYQLPKDQWSFVVQPFIPAIRLNTQVRLVEVPVVVKDGFGNSVADLTAADFNLRIDGKPVPISTFSKEVATGTPGTRAVVNGRVTAGPAVVAPVEPIPISKPRSIVIYIDDLNTSVNDIANVRRAAEEYVRHDIASKDLVAVYSTQPAATQDFTTDHDAVIHALDGISSHDRAHDYQSCPHLTPWQAYDIEAHFSAALDSLIYAEYQCATTMPPIGTHTKTDNGANGIRQQAENIYGMVEMQSQKMFDQMSALVDYLSRQPGDRVLVLASAGFITPTLQERIQRLTEQALKAGVVINSVDALGLYPPYVNPPDDPQSLVPQLTNYRQVTFGHEHGMATDVMAQLSQGTGGTFIENTNDFRGAFDQLGNPPKVAYTLGFTFPGTDDGNYHSISVHVQPHGAFDVTARPGFFAPTKKDALIAATDQQRLIDQVFSHDALGEIGSAVVVDPTNPLAIQVLVEIDPRTIPYHKESGRDVDSFTLVAALLDPTGKLVTGQQATLAVRLTPSSLARISVPGTGLRAGLTMAAAPGTYQLRTVVMETNGKKLATLSTDVRVR